MAVLMLASLGSTLAFAEANASNLPIITKSPTGETVDIGGEAIFVAKYECTDIDMIVANPIYDIVFKYLMEDERIARTILSDKYYKTLNLFHQMYQIGNDKHELTQFESIYSNDEDLFYILNFLESVNNSDIKKEMLKEDEYVFFIIVNSAIILTE